MAAKGETIQARVEPALADAVETMARRQGRSVSEYLRHLAMRDTALDERASDDPPEDDADYIERAVSGLAGAGHALIERAREADEAGRESLLNALIGFVVWGAAPRPDAEGIRTYADMVARKRGH